MRHDDVLERLRRCLHLKNNGATAGEVEAALAAARRIAVRHQIDIAAFEIQNHDEKRFREEFHEEKLALGLRKSVLTKCILWILGGHFNVRVIYVNPHVAFLGSGTDVAFAVYVHGFLSGEFQRLWDSYRKKTGCGVRSRNSYVYGLYRGLDAHLKRESESTAAERLQEIEVNHGALFRQKTERQLAVVGDRNQAALSQYMKTLYPRLRTTRESVVLRDRGAESEGQRDGGRIRIRKPVADQRSKGFLE